MLIHKLSVTISEYLELDFNYGRMELINGCVVESRFETPSHGYICANVGCAVQLVVRKNKLGTVVSNTCFVVTSKNPDSVRSPDVAYYSFSIVRNDPYPRSVWPAPELAFEVMSEHDQWSEMNAKAGEYLRADVKVVCILDPGEAVLAVYQPDQSPIRLGRDDTFAAPELFPDWSVPVREFLD